MGGGLSLIAAIGAGASLLAHGNYNLSGPEWMAVYAAAGAAWTGFKARDNKVTSEEAKAGGK